MDSVAVVSIARPITTPDASVLLITSPPRAPLPHHYLQLTLCICKVQTDLLRLGGGNCTASHGAQYCTPENHVSSVFADCTVTYFATTVAWTSMTSIIIDNRSRHGTIVSTQALLGCDHVSPVSANSAFLLLQIFL